MTVHSAILIFIFFLNTCIWFDVKQQLHYLTGKLKFECLTKFVQVNHETKHADILCYISSNSN